MEDYHGGQTEKESRKLENTKGKNEEKRGVEIDSSFSFRVFVLSGFRDS
jgi:hypothetical protein